MTGNFKSVIENIGKAALLLSAAPIALFAITVITVVIVVQINDLLEQAGICLNGQRIETPAEALAFAKNLILTDEARSSDPHFARSGFQSPHAYMRAIEVKDGCCSASYGKRFHEGASRGWSVTIDAIHLKEKYSHEIEFSWCGTVTYNGGLSYN